MAFPNLEYRFCDDWLIFAEDEDGNAYMACTEVWPEWFDVAQSYYPHLPDYLAYKAFMHRIEDETNVIERYMLPVARKNWDRLNWEKIPAKEMAESRQFSLRRFALALQALAAQKSADDAVDFHYSCLERAKEVR